MDKTNNNIITILNELNKAVKMHNFYPAGHPHFDTALDNCLQLLKQHIIDTGELKFSIDHKGFFYGEKPVSAGSKDLRALAKKFFLRRIKELHITSSVTDDDIKNLIFILRYEPDEILAMGGVESVLAEKGVEGILLNEMRYEELKRLKAELEAKRTEAEEMGAEEEETENKESLKGENPESAALEDAPEEGRRGEETLPELIRKLKTERDFLLYNDLSVRIGEKANYLSRGNAEEDAFEAVAIFHEHAGADSGLPDDLRQIAEEQLDALISNEAILRYIAGRAELKEDPLHELVLDILLRGGDRAIKILLDEAVGAPDASLRRNLFNTVLLFGKSIIPHVEQRLKSGEWFVVRQMVALLGELGDPEYINLIEEAYGHEDMRIKREVLKSLARINSPESTAFLLNALSDEAESLSRQAIVSLGVRRDPAAVDSLGKIALVWERFADRNETQKEAIKALGTIGDLTGVDYLKKILFRKSWFGKRSNLELRQLAAASLGMIGGDEAYRAVESAFNGAEGELYTTCKRILDKKEKDH
ncbi:MAG: HEAT repeat domain-containing protein [Thermodesulfobacteriota bacterium]